MKKLSAFAATMLLFAAPVLAEETAAPAMDNTAAPAVTAPAKPVKKAAKAKNEYASEETAIKKVFKEVGEAWAAGDAKGLASHWVADGSLINPFGQAAWTRDEVEQVAAADLQTMKGSTQTFEDFKFRFIMGGFALVDCTATISGMKNADGTEAPAKQFHLVGAVAKRGAKWQALSIRPYAFVPMPTAEADTTAPSTFSSTGTDATEK